MWQEQIMWELHLLNGSIQTLIPYQIPQVQISFSMAEPHKRSLSLKRVQLPSCYVMDQSHASMENKPNLSTHNPVSVDIQSLAALLSQLSTLHASIARSNINPIADSTSPFYLHPSIPITALVLNTQNYHQWARSMWLALKSKNKLGFIEGDIPKLEKTDPLYDAWDRCNTYVISWTNLSLSQEISQSVIWRNIASDLWNDLKKRYYKGDVFRVVELNEEFFSIRQGDLSVMSYFTRLKSIWEEIESFRHVPNCVFCVENCTCGLGIMRGYKQEDYVVRFLRGLNEQYSAVKLQIMLIKLPDIDAVFSMLTQQERQSIKPFKDQI